MEFSDARLVSVNGRRVKRGRVSALVKWQQLEDGCLCGLKLLEYKVAATGPDQLRAPASYLVGLGLPDICMQQKPRGRNHAPRTEITRIHAYRGLDSRGIGPIEMRTNEVSKFKMPTLTKKPRRRQPRRQPRGSLLVHFPNGSCLPSPLPTVFPASLEGVRCDAKCCSLPSQVRDASCRTCDF